MSDTKEAEYFLHVREIRSPHPPDNLPCMRVDVIRVNGVLFDEVRMSDARLGREEWIFVLPHGRGWRVFDTRADGYTIYRRPHVPVFEPERRTALAVGAA